jgi:hypothetical protein
LLRLISLQLLLQLLIKPSTVVADDKPTAVVAADNLLRLIYKLQPHILIIWNKRSTFAAIVVVDKPSAVVDTESFRINAVVDFSENNF